MPRQPLSSPAAGLADTLRDQTRTLHIRAERSGIVADLLRGRGARCGYALFLRSLLPVYRRLEDGLQRRCAVSLAGLAEPAVYRSAAIEADLLALAGHGWRRRLPLLDQAEAYADRVAAAAADPGRLAAHAYTRFLGDLNGGRMLRRVLVRTLALDGAALGFYDYPLIEDVGAFAARYRRAFDTLGVDVAAAVDEAREAFRLNIALSEQVGGEAARRSA